MANQTLGLLQSISSMLLGSLTLTHRSKEFIPFEGDWKAMMMRWNKANLVNFLSLKLKELQAERQRCEGLEKSLNEIKDKMAQPPDRISKITIRDYSVLRLSVLRIAEEALSAPERRDAEGKCEHAKACEKHGYLGIGGKCECDWECAFCKPTTQEGKEGV